MAALACRGRAGRGHPGQRAASRASPLLAEAGLACPPRPTSSPPPAAAFRPCALAAWARHSEGRGVLRVTRWLPVDGAPVLGVLTRPPGRAGGGQDSHGQQYPQGSGGGVGDRVRGVEAGHGRLRGRRGADQQCGPARPARPRLASARGPHAQPGRDQAGRDQPGCGQPRGRRGAGPPPGRDRTGSGPGLPRRSASRRSDAGWAWVAAGAACSPSAPAAVMSQGMRSDHRTRSRRGPPAAGEAHRSA